MTEENLYARARLLVKREAYDEAIVVYEQLLARVLHDDDILRELGLVYAANGQPYEALQQWVQMIDMDDAMIDLIEETYRKLPAYNHVFAQYNEAIYALKEKQFQQAQLLLHRVCTQSLPLPPEVYEAFILAMQYDGNDDKIATFVSKWPRRIQKHLKIQQLLQLKETVAQQAVALEQMPEEEAAPQKNWVMYAAIVAVLVGALLFLIWSQLKPEEQTPAVEEQQAVEQQVNEPVQQQEAPAEKLAVPLSEDQIRVIYDQGLAAYEAGKYNEARDVFEHGTTVDQSSYMADDMAFFLAKTYEALGDQTRATELYEFIVTNEGNSFKKSSYRDDSLLQLVNAYGSVDAAYAKKLAEQIVAEYPNEWTATIAKQHLEKLQ